MEDGTYTIFQIQVKPVGIVELKDKNHHHLVTIVPYDGDWADSGFCNCEFIMEPENYGYNKSHPKVIRKSKKEKYEVWCKTGLSGYFTKRYAVEALKRLEKQNYENNINTRDGYGKIDTVWKCEFRIIKRKLSQKTKVIKRDKL